MVAGVPVSRVYTDKPAVTRSVGSGVPAEHAVHLGRAAGAGPALLRLQQERGNHYVQRLVRRAVIQPKLMVTGAGDRHEREADRIARQVVRQDGPGILEGTASEAMQSPGVAVSGMDVTPQVEAGIGRARGGGQALPASVRQPLELAFGADFRRVRVHADGAADALNRVLNARAFTTGQNIFLRRGYFSPGSPSGKELLAHELAHVVQQGSGTDVAQRFTDEDVKVRAYYMWEKKGRPEQDRQGQEEDYFRARRELVQEEAVKLVDDDRDLDPTFAAEIKASLSAPELINQGQFNFCGPNDFLMAIALKDPVAYVKYVLDVHAAERERTTGLLPPGRTARLGRMAVAMDPGVLGAASGTFPSSGGTSISQTDWMSMGSIRKHATVTAPAPVISHGVQTILTAFTSGGAPAALAAVTNPADLETAIMALKKGFESTPGQSLEALALLHAPTGSPIEMVRKIAEGTSPDELAHWLTNYGATDVTKAASFDHSRTTHDLLAANTDLAAGKSVMLQIDAPAGLQGSHRTVTFDPTQGHWVLMKTPFRSSSAPDPVWKCNVYSWGAVQVLKILESRIQDAYYGRVSATITTP